MTEFGIVSSDATPTHDIFSEEKFLSHRPPKRKEIFPEAVEIMVHEYMFSFKFESEATAQQESQTKSQRGKKAKEKGDKVDHVTAYAREVLTLGSLYMEYCDAIWERDGLRIVR